MLVKDVMTVDVHVLRAEMAVEEAAAELTSKHFGGAPVVDGSGRVVGVLSKGDLADLAPGAAETKVDQAMTPLVFSLRPHDPVMTAIRLMLLEGIHRVIVLDDSGAIAGIVTPMDILRAVERGEAVEPTTEVAPADERHADPALAIEAADET